MILNTASSKWTGHDIGLSVVMQSATSKTRLRQRRNVKASHGLMMMLILYETNLIIIAKVTDSIQNPSYALTLCPSFLCPPGCVKLSLINQSHANISLLWSSVTSDPSHELRSPPIRLDVTPTRSSVAADRATNHLG